MVAIVISLILLTGVLHIMLSNRASLTTQQALAGLQSRARLLNVVLDDAVAPAGYQVDPAADKTNVFAAETSHTPPIAAGAAVAASSTSDLRARFQSAGGLHDCYGHTTGGFPTGKSSVPATSSLNPVLSDFALEYDTSKQTLNCQVYEPQSKSGTEPLFSNILAFKTLFGLDTSGNGSVDTFVTQITQAQQSEVVSVRVQALLQTRQKRVLQTPISRTFKFFDGYTITVHQSRRAFLLFDRTVALKNNLR